VRARERLLAELHHLVQRSRIELAPGVVAPMPCADGVYQGIWPDDFLYPLLAEPALAERGELQRVAEFLTESLVDLAYVPDRVRRDGLPILSPGGERSPLSWDMPRHLPGAWVRLLDVLEQHGVDWPRRREWAALIERSFARVSFARGLVYVDPQRPLVGFGFNDTIAITGLELFSSLVLLRGFERAERLFEREVSSETLERWRERAAGIRAGLGALFDPELGGFAGGSCDGRQLSVWGSALAAPLATQDQRATIVETLRAKRDAVFLRGCTRHVAEPAGWSRTLASVPAGSYQNGGFWPTGTGYVLPLLAELDPDRAAVLASELAEELPRLEHAEWIDAEGRPQGARAYLASAALPALGLRAIAEGRALLDYF
jgi:hypothetical protein